MKPVVKDLRGDSQEDDAISTKTTTNSTLTNLYDVTVVTLSLDSKKENRGPELMPDDIELSQKQTLVSPNRKESTPSNKILKTN